jgi:hypothetical protein
LLEKYIYFGRLKHTQSDTSRAGGLKRGGGEKKKTRTKVETGQKGTTQKLDQHQAPDPIKVGVKDRRSPM